MMGGFVLPGADTAALWQLERYLASFFAIQVDKGFIRRCSPSACEGK